MKDFEFSFIVDAMLETLKSNWVYVQLEFEAMPGYCSYTGKYKMSADDSVTSLPADKLPSYFPSKLKEKFSKDNQVQNIWNKGRIICYPDGDLKLELMWDDDII